MNTAKILEQYRYTYKNYDVKDDGTQRGFFEDDEGIVHGVYQYCVSSGEAVFAFQCAFISVGVRTNHAGPVTCLYCITFTE